MPCLLDFSKKVVMPAVVPVDGSLFVSLREMCLPRVVKNELEAMLPKAYLQQHHV